MRRGWLGLHCLVYVGGGRFHSRYRRWSTVVWCGMTGAVQWHGGECDKDLGPSVRGIMTWRYLDCDCSLPTVPCSGLPIPSFSNSAHGNDPGQQHRCTLQQPTSCKSISGCTHSGSAVSRYNTPASCAKRIARLVHILKHICSRPPSPPTVFSLSNCTH